MITTTHVTINGALSRLAGSARSGGFARAVRRLLPDRSTRRAILLGGVAPDLGLFVLSTGAAVWFPLVEGWDLRTTFDHIYRDLFYADTAWIIVHNTLHAPLVLLGLIGLGRRLGGSRGRWLTAFAVGCLLHTALDIPTHVDDGPLVWFPLDWSTRFASPVSYWDPRYGGNILGPIDQAITALGGGWLALTWWRRRRAERADARAGTDHP